MEVVLKLKEKTLQAHYSFLMDLFPQLTLSDLNLGRLGIGTINVFVCTAACFYDALSVLSGPLLNQTIQSPLSFL